MNLYVPVDVLARRCDMSVDAVYEIKNRLTKRLRVLVAELTSAHNEGE